MSFNLFTKTPIILVTIWLSLCLTSSVNAQENHETISKAAVSTYAQDLAAFKRLHNTLSQLSAEVKQRSDLFGQKAVGDVTLLRPEIRQQIFSFWYAILDNYLALDTLAEKYSGFYQQADEKKQEGGFHISRGIFLTQYRFALEIIADFEQNPIMDTILNEANEPLGLPPGVYTHFKYQYLNVIKAGRFAALEAVAKGYNVPGDSQIKMWAREDSRIILDAGKGPGPLMTLKNGLSMIKKLGFAAWFPVQKGVAEWMGQTKVWRPREYLIQPHQIKVLNRKLEPGDILLERREWYLTNVGIPGFWTHAALYIGNADQRDALSKYPEVKDWLHRQGVVCIDDLIKKRYPKAYTDLHLPYDDGLLPQVIEAVSPGVILTSLNHSAICDSLAVLRPRLSIVDRAAAVVRAMRYYGHPYDYAFDFGTDTSLVCTELVVKSYLPGELKQGLRLPLENVMGNMVTPANAFVREFDKSFGTREQQMDLVLFLDGQEKDGKAAESSVEAFRGSWHRPKWYILLQYAQTNKD